MSPSELLRKVATGYGADLVGLQTDDFPSIDITFDGADDVDRHLNAIKGGGACHLREKVVAERSQHFVSVFSANNALRRVSDLC